MTRDCFRPYMIREYQKIISLLGKTPDELPRFVTKIV